MSPSELLRKWSSAFKNRPKPERNTVYALIEKFEKTGSVGDDKESMASAIKTQRTPEKIEQARALMDQHPTTSVRKLAQQVDVSVGTAWAINRKDLNIFPYKLQVGQPLTQESCAKRLDFANAVCEALDDNEPLFDPKKIIFSDEAHFWLDGYVNRQNYRVWGTQRPELVVSKPLHPKKLTVWCGLSASGIIGPFFIEQTINSERYKTLLENDVIPELIEKGLIDDHWFQQDGAPPHSTNMILDYLRDNFGDRVIARNFTTRFGDGYEWPPYSPDLSPLDFYLWGYIKDSVYSNRPRTLEELKSAIKTTIQNIPMDIFPKVIDHFCKRVRHVVTVEGAHIENIIN